MDIWSMVTNPPYCVDKKSIFELLSALFLFPQMPCPLGGKSGPKSGINARRKSKENSAQNPLQGRDNDLCPGRESSGAGDADVQKLDE